MGREKMGPWEEEPLKETSAGFARTSVGTAGRSRVGFRAFGGSCSPVVRPAPAWAARLLAAGTPLAEAAGPAPSR